MICPQCRSEIPDKAKFCHECGRPLSSASRPSEAEASPSGVGAARTIPEQPAGSGIGPVSVGKRPTLVVPGLPGQASATSGAPLSARYEILSEIGRGGFAVVYKAHDRHLDRLVAIKRLLPDPQASQQADQTVARFQHEALLIAKLNHRNIVGIFDTNRDSDGFYIVMEYVEGGSLRDRIKARGGALPVPESVSLMKGVAQGVAYAHRMGLIHRDLKPANILLAKDGDDLIPKIVDFGLARAGRDSTLSISGYGMGTPYYMPPEQRRDAKNVTHTADIYALGKTLYEMVTGEIPDQVDPDKIPPPPRLRDIIFKCVKAKPEERFFSADELIQALETLGGRAGRRAAPHGALAAGEDACPACGLENDKAARFCAGCGQGLFKQCPECDREFRIQVPFCSACGTEMDGFGKAIEIVQRMQEHAQAKRWSRVLKEAGQWPAALRLPGPKGRKLADDAAAFRRAAEEALRKLEALKADAASARADDRFEEARALLSQLRDLDPHNPEIATALREIEGRIEEQDYRAALADARARMRDRPATAADPLAAFLKRHGHPQSELSNTVEQIIARDIPEALRYRQASDLAARAASRVADRQFDHALSDLDAAGPMLAGLTDQARAPEWAAPQPGGTPLPSPAELRARLDRERDRLTALRQQAADLRGQAETAVQAGAWERACALFKEAAAMYPMPDDAASFTDVAARAVAEQTQVRALSEQAETAAQHLEQRRLQHCRAVLAALPAASSLTVHESASWHAAWRQAADSLQQSAQALSEQEQRLAALAAEAEAAFADRDCERCVEICQQAAALSADPAGVEPLLLKAKNLAAKLKANLDEARRHAAQRQWTRAASACTLALSHCPTHAETKALLARAEEEMARARRRRRRAIEITAVAGLSILAAAAVIHEGVYAYRVHQFHWLQRHERGLDAHRVARSIERRNPEARRYIEDAAFAVTCRDQAETARASAVEQKADREDAAAWRQASAMLAAGDRKFNAGDMDGAAGEWRNAVPLFAEAESLAAQHAVAANASAVLCNAKRDGAVKAAAPVLAGAVWQAADTLVQQGQTAYAQGAYTNAAGLWQAAASQFDAARTIAVHSNVAVSIAAARAAETRGDWRAALDQAAAALRLDSASAPAVEYAAVLRSNLVQRALDTYLKAPRQRAEVSALLEALADEARDPLAHVWLARLRLRQGRGSASHRAEADARAAAGLPGLRRLADQGHPLAQYLLGTAFREALGVASNSAEAVVWFQRAASNQCALAMRSLGFAYASGRDVEKNPARAAAWLEQAAKAGYTEAMCDLGQMLEAGDLGAPDYPQALHWYRQAAEKGDGRGMFLLAMLHKDGLGTPKDAAAALRWFEASAEAGNPNGLRSLANCHQYGLLGLKPDPARARALLQQAAEAGHTGAVAAIEGLQGHRSTH